MEGWRHKAVVWAATSAAHAARDATAMPAQAFTRSTMSPVPAASHPYTLPVHHPHASPKVSLKVIPQEALVLLGVLRCIRHCNRTQRQRAQRGAPQREGQGLKQRVAACEDHWGGERGSGHERESGARWGGRPGSRLGSNQSAHAQDCPVVEASCSARHQCFVVAPLNPVNPTCAALE